MILIFASKEIALATVTSEEAKQAIDAVEFPPKYPSAVELAGGEGYWVLEVFQDKTLVAYPIFITTKGARVTAEHFKESAKLAKAANARK